MEANNKYKEVIKEIENNLKVLNEKLKQHQLKQSNETNNWGYVGDISYINTQLGNINEFIK